MTIKNDFDSVQANAQALHEFANADENTTVNLPSGGQVSSIKKFLKDKDAEINAGADPIYAAAQARVEASEQAAAGHVNTLIAEGLDANKSSEHNFKARQAILKAMYDRSGFIEMGRTYQAGTYPSVNDGLWTQPTQQYMMALGSGDLADSGDSNSNHPIMNIDGVAVHIRGIDYINEATVNQLKLAPAPKVEHIDTTYGGRVKNSDFSLGDNGDWTLGNAAITGGKLTYSSGAADYVQQLNVLDANIVNFIEIKVESMTAGRIDVYGTGLIKSITEAGTYFIRHDNDSYVHLNLYGYNTNAVVTKVAAWPEYQQNRTDLLMMEFWPEDTAILGVLHRYGNTQDKTADDGYLGVAKNAGTFNGADTYSLVSEEWQNAGDLVGNCYVIAALTFAQLAKFTTDPTNNCYYTPDGKLIQARKYRYRAPMGKGDNWEQINAYQGGSEVIGYNINHRISVKGAAVSLAQDLGGAGTEYVRYNSSIGLEEVGAGLLVPRNNVLGRGFEDKVYGYILGTSARLNQDVHHDIYNQRGARGWYKQGVSENGHWSMLPGFVTSAIECFDPTNIGEWNVKNGISWHTGDISTGRSGHPSGRYFDAVYAKGIGGFVDCRRSAFKQFSEEKTLSHIVSESARGLEGETVFERVRDTGNLLYNYGAGDVGFYASIEKTSEYAIGDIVAMALYHNGQWYMDQGRIAIGAHGSGYIRMTAPNISAAVPVGYLVADGANFVCWSGQTKGQASGEILVADVIGDYANYPQWLKDALKNGYSMFGRPLTTGKNGEDYLPDGTVKTFEWTRKVKSSELFVSTIDAGVNWTSAAVALDANTNSTTYGAAANEVAIHFYYTCCDVLEPSAIQEFESSADVFASASASYSTTLIESLIRKVPTFNGFLQQDRKTISAYGLLPVSGRLGIDTSFGDLPTHDALNLANTQTSMAKAWPYKSADNVHFLFKEMKHNGTSHGDNGKFTPKDNVGLDIDNNGDTILIGHKSVKLPSDLR